MTPLPINRSEPRRLPPAAALLPGLLFLGIYLYRNGFVVWPTLFQSAGDFRHYYEAARAILLGESPFTPSFDYPPLVALVVLPLAVLSLDGARVVWFLLSHACLLGAALCLWRPLGRDLAAFVALGVVWSLAGTVQENLALGQVHPLLLLLLALVFRWDASRPRRAAAALGLAAGLKVWPGLVLAADLSRTRRRSLVVGLGVAAACVVLPLLFLAVFLPPPHVPVSGSYWMGTPAARNVSLPALAVRLTYELPEDGALPTKWRTGNSPVRFYLEPFRRLLSVAVSLATLGAGLAAIGWTVRRRAPLDAAGRLHILAALTALATLASPISWFHYQIFQFPGFALLGAELLRKGRSLLLVGLAALVVGLTRQVVRGLLWTGSAGEVLAMGAVIVVLNMVLFLWLVFSLPRPGLPRRTLSRRLKGGRERVGG